jgi:TRAP-type mannitol/chloroaromatic compound transport system permease large subunit
MSPDVAFRDIALGVIPFIVLMLAFIAVLYAFPGIVTWLPSKVG